MASTYTHPGQILHVQLTFNLHVDIWTPAVYYEQLSNVPKKFSHKNYILTDSLSVLLSNLDAVKR